MDQLLESKGKSGDSVAANLGEEEQIQKGKEVGDQQNEQQAEAEGTEEEEEEDDDDDDQEDNREEEEEEEEDDDDDQEDNREEEDDNEDETTTEQLKSFPKVTNTSKEFYIHIYEEEEEEEEEDDDDQEDNHEEEDDNEDETTTERFKSFPKKMKQLQHFIHPKHPLVFNEERIYGEICYGCQEPILGPSYSCEECRFYEHHKSCAELPLGLLHHPLHPLHPLILFPEWTDHPEGEKSNCDVCKKKRGEYCYFCYRCNFKLHIKCGSLAPATEAPEVHHHPLIPLWRWMMFTCDFCGKEDKGIPYVCTPCGFLIHRRCANFPGRLKVIRHNHPLNLIHSLELHQSNSQVCQLCFLKVDTNYGLYYCFRCGFAAHLHCAMSEGNMEDINLLEFKEEESAESKAMLENEDSKLHQSVDSEICKVIKIAVGEDGIKIATKIEHFSHEHHLKLTDEVPNNKICDGCVRAILTPSFYSCVNCSFFLHISCTKLPKKKQYPLHQHPLTLSYRKDFHRCFACWQWCNGLYYGCLKCYSYMADFHCSLISNTLTHACHKHPLYLSITNYKQNCSICGSENYGVFRCTTCEFVLDFKCATVPQTAWYNQHEHPFTLRCTPEDDSGEYYCDICEEERDTKQWFYYCEDCSYPAHSKCILGENPNAKRNP